jgi:hypothetical protein
MPPLLSQRVNRTKFADFIDGSFADEYREACKKYAVKSFL